MKLDDLDLTIYPPGPSKSCCEIGAERIRATGTVAATLPAGHVWIRFRPKCGCDQQVLRAACQINANLRAINAAMSGRRIF